MLVQYEDQSQPPPLTSTWSWQDTRGSSVLIFLAWVGLLIGAAGTLYWAHFSVLGAIYGTIDWPGYVWIALTSAGAAIVAPVMWPFLEERRPKIANFVLTVGVICWLVTSASGTLYLIVKSEIESPSLATAPLRWIENALDKDYHSVIDAEHDCRIGVLRGCNWLNSRNGHDTRTRIEQYENERTRRKTAQPEAQTPTPIKLVMRLRQRMALFLTVAFGGAIALALVWGPAEALKAMYSEPGTLYPKIGLPGLNGLALPGAGPLSNPVDMSFESWANTCLERARGEHVPLSTLHAHYMAYCIQRGLPTFANDAAFGRALNRPPDQINPNDLGGPMLRLGAFPHKTGGKMEYIGVRIIPDSVLDDIQGGQDV